MWNYILSAYGFATLVLLVLTVSSIARYRKTLHPLRKKRESET